MDDRQDERDSADRAERAHDRAPRVRGARSGRRRRHVEQASLRQAIQGHPHHRLGRRNLQFLCQKPGERPHAGPSVAVPPDERRGAVQAVGPVASQVVDDRFIEDLLDDELFLPRGRLAGSMGGHHGVPPFSTGSVANHASVRPRRGDPSAQARRPRRSAAWRSCSAASVAPARCGEAAPGSPDRVTAAVGARRSILSIQVQVRLCRGGLARRMSRSIIAGFSQILSACRPASRSRSTWSPGPGRPPPGTVRLLAAPPQRFGAAEHPDQQVILLQALGPSS